jgi:dolichol-phosphate mannosyltransferase
MGYERIVQMDCDFSHDPGTVPTLVAKLDGADLVLGSRYVPGGGTVNWGLIRKIISRGGSAYARMILGVRYRDLTGGFKAWRRETLLAIPLDRVAAQGYCFQIEMTYRAHRLGKKIVESPITFVDRRVGQSKMSKKIVLEAVTRVWELRKAV